MLSIAQRIDYAAAAIAAAQGGTSDQVLARILGPGTKPELEQLALLEGELRRLRPVVPQAVGKVREQQLYFTTGGA